MQFRSSTEQECKARSGGSSEEGNLGGPPQTKNRTLRIRNRGYARTGTTEEYGSRLNCAGNRPRHEFWPSIVAVEAT